MDSENSGCAMPSVASDGNTSTLKHVASKSRHTTT